MAHEGVPLIVIQRQLGHSNLGITSIYLQGIDNAEIIDAVHAPPRADGPGERLARALRRMRRRRSSRNAALLPMPDRAVPSPSTRQLPEWER
jgi:hypothetical protein